MIGLKFTKIIAFFFTFCFSFYEIKAQQLSLPKIFSNGMIIQRNKPILVTGNYIPNKKITISFEKKIEKILSDENGSWKAELESMNAGGPYTMKVSGETGDSVIIKNILIGDVWFCAGQSNMNFILSADKSWQSEKSNLNNPQIREFRCAMPEGLINPENEEHSQWRQAIGDKAKLFSAVAYYFAKQIQLSENIPIGIVVMACGGARAEAFTDVNDLKQNPNLQPLMNYWKDKMNDLKLPQNQVPGKFFDNIKSILPFSIKGILFYQGESNTLPDQSGRSITERADEYEAILKTLIFCYRQTWNNNSLPFYLIQLPNYIDKSGDIQWAKIRQAQLNILKTLPNTGLVVTIDVGDSTDIHPKNKKTVGERAARWALHDVYKHKNILECGPIIKNVFVKNEKTIIKFDYISGGLKGKEPFTEFEISDQSHPDLFIPAHAQINKNKIILFSDKVKKPSAIRYGWKDNPKAELFNDEGLPASPYIYFIKKKSH